LKAKYFEAYARTQLNGGTLDGATITVTSDVAHEDEAHDIADRDGDNISQEHKPRAGSTYFLPWTSIALMVILA
jgi:hypothetical protein